MLDGGRLGDDGVRHRVWPRELDDLWPMLLLTQMLSALPEPHDGVRNPRSPRHEFSDTASAVDTTKRRSIRVLNEPEIAGAQAYELVSRALAGYADPHGDPQAELVRLARGMSDVPAAVAVERPPVPELTDRPLENARRLFGLTVGQLADLFGVTERQMHRYLRDGLPENRRALADALTAVGLTVIGGLGAEGARRWLFSGEPTGAQLAKRGGIAELAARAEGLRDSPIT
jgi:hypothetical protein